VEALQKLTAMLANVEPGLDPTLDEMRAVVPALDNAGQRGTLFVDWGGLYDSTTGLRI